MYCTTVNRSRAFKIISSLNMKNNLLTFIDYIASLLANTTIIHEKSLDEAISIL
jgi:hypothetical protein